MGLDMAKYRLIFLEEATDHLAEMSRAMLGLEKEMSSGEAIDTLFRMAHSIKSMAASLGYDSIALLSHSLEDRMEGIRADGRVRSHDELSLLFQVLEMLESMVSSVNDEAEIPEVPSELLEALAAPETGGRAAPITPPSAVGGEPKKVRV